MIFRRSTQTPEDRERRAQSALRRAVWYLIVLAAILLFLARPQLLLRIWRQPTNPAYDLLQEK